MADLKQLAAQQALESLQDGMALGLGSGSTAACFVQLLGERVQAGTLRQIVGVPTSEKTARQAAALGIPLTTLTELERHRPPPLLDLVIDGADEVDAELNLIKGLGQALLREKIIASYARRFVVIVDESKLVARLGRGPLPVEIVQFEAGLHVRWLASLGCRAELWREADGRPIVTDNGNFLARCWFETATGAGIPDVPALARVLAERPGIVEHGLFLGMASEVIVAGQVGIRRMT
jgi:ribose 5-phosphate isomerase A